MASCKDCICFDACMDYTKLKESEFAQNIDGAEISCDHFKNKADFVEVVRCKDCDYFVPLGDAYEYKGKKAMHCILRASCTGDNYYCADGMRKDVTDINVGSKEECK